MRGIAIPGCVVANGVRMRCASEIRAARLAQPCTTKRISGLATGSPESNDGEGPKGGLHRWCASYELGQGALVWAGAMPGTICGRCTSKRGRTRRAARGNIHEWLRPVGRAVRFRCQRALAQAAERRNRVALNRGSEGKSNGTQSTVATLTVGKESTCNTSMRQQRCALSIVQCG